MLVYGPVQLSSFEGYFKSSLFLIPQSTARLPRDKSFIGKTWVWHFLYIFCICFRISGFTVSLWQLYTSIWAFDVFFLNWGIRILSHCFNIKYNFMFIPYLLYKKTPRCTFACVTLFNRSLLPTAEHSNIPGPVQIHNTCGTLENKRGIFLSGFRKRIGAIDQHVIPLAYNRP